MGADQLFAASKFVTVTPSDTDNLVFDTDKALTTRGIYVGVTGDISCLNEFGDTVLLKNLAPGMIHPIRTNKIFQTDTTATDIVAFW